MIKKSIWVISLFEPTPVDNTRPMRSMSIAAAANEKGIQVHHFACTFRHATKVERFKKSTSIKSNEMYQNHYVYASPYVKNTSLARFVSHKEFTNNLMDFIKIMEKPDVILVAYPPISTLRKLIKWGMRNRVPVVMDIIDPWPDVFLRFAPKLFRPFTSFILLPFSFRLRTILKSVSGVTAISKEYIDWAKSKGVSIKKTAFFYPSVPVNEIQYKLEKITVKKNKDDKLRLIYAGNLGVAYDIPIILDIAQKIENKYPGKTMFTICGVGHYESLVEATVKKFKNIRFLGRLTHESLLDEYKNNHIGLSQYKVGATQSVTYKLFDYLAAGLPVLNSLPTEMAEIINKYNVGFNNLPNQPEILFENIIKYINSPELINIQKNNAIALAYQHGDNKIVYGEMIEFLMKK